MCRPERLTARALGLAILLAGPGGAVAETMVGNAAEGLKLAREACTGCHDVEREGPVTTSPEAKPFRDIAADPKYTALSLRVFLRTPHIEMPDYILTEDQTDDVIAHILSLK